MIDSIQHLYAPLLLLSAIVAGTVSAVAWRRRPAPGALGLATMMGAACFWAAIYTLEWLFTDHGPSFAFMAARSIGMLAIPASSIVLVLGYTGRTRLFTRRNAVLLASVPVFLWLLLVTDPWTHLYLNGEPPEMHLVTGGPAFFLITAYCYLALLVSIGLLGAHLLRQQGVYRLQTAVLMSALLLPSMVSVVDQNIVRLLPVINSTPVAFIVSGPLLAYGLFGLGLLRIIPIARDRVIEELPDGVVLIDPDMRVVDMNPAARVMAGASSRDIGRTVDDVFSATPDAVVALKRLIAQDGSVAQIRTDSLPPRSIEVSASPVREPDGELVATLLVLRDVTEAAEMHEQLESRSKELAATLERTNLVVAAMAEGVMLVDERGRLLRSNPAASRILRANFDSADEAVVGELAPALPVAGLSERAWAHRAPVTDVIDLADGRSITVEATPLLKAHSSERQTLLVIRDETERLAAERMQRDFVANVSHELQTPLTGLSLLADTLPHAVREDPGQVDGFVKRLGSEVKRMVRMTSELMTLSRLEDPRFASGAPMEEVDLSAHAAEIAEGVALLASAKGQELTVDAAPGVLILGDQASLDALIVGLLENAVRYTPEGGHVSLSTHFERDAAGRPWAVLTVTDDGVGISEEDQPRVFERFFRVDKARARATGGSGLGLSIVQRSAEQHGGTVHLASRLGAGSAFTVRIPAIAGADVAEAS